MIPPMYGGSTRSKLISMLEKGHHPASEPDKTRVKLSREELDKLCAWIDLVIPFCGDYFEANAWSDKELEYARARMELSENMKEIDRNNIKDYLKILVAGQ